MTTAMPRARATMIPLEPLRGALERDARGGAMEGLLIPDRPQSGRDTIVGRKWMQAARDHATRALGLPLEPIYPDGFLRLEVELYYSLPDGAPTELPSMPRRWADWSIPNTDGAAGLLLAALKGPLYASTGQVQPLVVSRFVLPSAALETRFGRACRRGCAVVRHAAA